MTEEPPAPLADFERYRKEVQALRERLGSAISTLERGLVPPASDEPQED